MGREQKGLHGFGGRLLACVVVDGDSFLNALFAPAGQGRRAMEHRPQDRRHRRRTLDSQLDDRGALEARLGNVFSDHQVWTSKLICSLECVSGRYEVRAAPYVDFASCLGRVAPACAGS